MTNVIEEMLYSAKLLTTIDACVMFRVAWRWKTNYKDYGDDRTEGTDDAAAQNDTSRSFNTTVVWRT